jgi:hypothetical protein
MFKFLRFNVFDATATVFVSALYLLFYVIAGKTLWHLEEVANFENEKKS